MQQLNILPVNVSQNVEIKDESASFTLASSKDDFSKYIDLHLNENKASENKSKLDSVETETTISSKPNASKDAKLGEKLTNDVVESSDVKEITDSEIIVQKVAASGNKGQFTSSNTEKSALLESEQLMSFLTKADSTLINKQPIDAIHIDSPEKLSIEQSAHYEAQLLLKSSNLVADLSAVAKALGNEQTASAEDILLSHVEKGVDLDSIDSELLIDQGKSENVIAEELVTLGKPLDSVGVLSEPELKAATKAEVSVLSTGNEKIASLLPEQEVEVKTKTDVNVQLTNKDKVSSVISEQKAEVKSTPVSKEKINPVIVGQEIEAKSKTEVNAKTEVNVTTISNEEVNSVIASQEAKAKTEVNINTISNDRVSASSPEKEIAILAKTEVNVSDGRTAAVIPEPKMAVSSAVETNTKKPVVNPLEATQASVDDDSETKNIKETSVATEQKVTKQVNSNQLHNNNEKLGQDTLAKVAVESRDSAVLNSSQLPENQNKVKPIEVKSQSQALDKSLNASVNPIDPQINPSQQLPSEKTSSVLDSLMTQSESIKRSEVLPSADKANQVATNLNINSEAVKRIQSTTNHLIQGDLIQDDMIKTEAKQSDKAQLSAAFSEQSQQKNAIKKDDVLVDNKNVEGSKSAAFTNHSVFDINGRATQTPQDRVDQQSVNMLSPTVATEVSQSQKTNAQLHQETISIFRKDFSDAVKDKVMLMISQKLQQFDITLDPPELGNMQVRVNLQGEQAVVNFMVQSQQTKDALEQNMHKLRELLAEQGVDVGDANVEQQSQQSENEESTAGNKSQRDSEMEHLAEENDVVAHTLSAQVINSSSEKVDYYA